ncbi:MAG: L-seryl-tRNA(Sec) selenium transferase [Solirubrobacteraceae bacterium]
MSATGQRRDRLRALPSVDRLAVALARVVLEERRAELLAGAQDDVDLIARARERLAPSLRRVLNCTGVVIHTNLGRVPLSESAIAAVEEAARGYSNLEMDMGSGRRGSREDHVRGLLRELTGAEDALVLNNGAAAVLLAVAALARARVVVSRGQLVEIGGGFRIPEIVAQAGAELLEVGTTNRTRLEDYTRVLDGEDVLLRVHQSNFRTVGFVEQVEIEPLCSLGIPVIDDLGSGALLSDARALAEEPQVRTSVAAGAALVCFSGDKLLGGPQAGVIVGRAEAVHACRRHPLARAMRIGRLPLAALEATLALYRDPQRAMREIPVLRMLCVDRRTLARRAQRLAEATGGEIVDAVARVGGGALPLAELEGPVVALAPTGGDAAVLAGALRRGDPALVPRIADGRVLIDPRTLAEEEVEMAIGAIRAAATGGCARSQ